MGSAESLMVAFKTTKDMAKKPAILRALEEFSSSELVVAFLLNIIRDENEFDLSRVEALKILEVCEIENPKLRTKAGGIVSDLMLNSPDDLVKNYAAIAAANYLEIKIVRDSVEKVVLDKHLDIDLRYNAFSAIKSAGRNPQFIDTLNTLMADDEFRESAARVLSEWN